MQQWSVRGGFATMESEEYFLRVDVSLAHLPFVEFVGSASSTFMYSSPLVPIQSVLGSKERVTVNLRSPYCVSQMLGICFLPQRRGALADWGFPQQSAFESSA